MYIACLPPGAPGRAPVEALIRRRYLEAYGARLRHFMPFLLTASAAGLLVAALGYQPASTGPLLAERYLERPVEEALSDRFGRPVRRAEVVEVGQFADVRPGAVATVIPPVTAHLYRAGYRWAVITAVRPVRRAFARLQLDLAPLAPARADRLDADAARDWGSYYAHGPVLLAGDIRAGHARLALAARREVRLAVPVEGLGAA